MITVSKTIKLSPIKNQDQALLEKLMWHIYPPPYKHMWENEDCTWYINRFYSQQALDKDLVQPNSHYYFIEYQEQLVVVFRIQFNTQIASYTNKTGTFIDRIYLNNMTQGKGVAATLFKWLENEAKQADDSFVWLKAMDSQEQALKFYTKQGMQTVGTSTYPAELLLKPLRGMLVMSKLI